MHIVISTIFFYSFFNYYYLLYSRFLSILAYIIIDIL